MRDPWEAGVGGIVNGNFAPEEEHLYLTAAANMTFLHHVSDVVDNPKRQMAMRTAIGYMAQDQTEVLRSSGALPDRADLKAHRAALLKSVRKRIPEHLCLALLVAGAMNLPFEPYQIPARKLEIEEALKRLAQDLGVPSSWVADTLAAIEEARAAQSSRGTFLKGAAVAIVGIGVLILALPLATVLAPAGVAGGAAFLSGLAALGGTTGVMGGIAVITTVGAVGGVTALSGALVAGSAREVEQNVLLLHSTAAAKAKIRPGTAPVAELHMLKDMKREVQLQLGRHKKVDQKKTLVKVLERKLEIIEKALTAFEKTD